MLVLEYIYKDKRKENKATVEVTLVDYDSKRVRHKPDQRDRLERSFEKLICASTLLYTFHLHFILVSSYCDQLSIRQHSVTVWSGHLRNQYARLLFYTIFNLFMLAACNC